MSTGFFVPKSVSSDYVTNKKTSDGSYEYDRASNSINLDKQVAINSLNKQYGTTINNAYASFLSANKGISGSAMGTGYKEAYMAANEQALQENIASTNLNAASARAEINTQASDAQNEVNELMTAEIANMDRVSSSLEEYFAYLKDVVHPSEADGYYLTEEQRNMTNIDTLYNTLLGAQPQGYNDINGTAAMAYSDWIRNNVGTNEADQLWYNWLVNGGRLQFEDAVKNGVNTL